MKKLPVILTAMAGMLALALASPVGLGSLQDSPQPQTRTERRDAQEAARERIRAKLAEVERLRAENSDNEAKVTILLGEVDVLIKRIRNKGLPNGTLPKDPPSEWPLIEFYEHSEEGTFSHPVSELKEHTEIAAMGPQVPFGAPKQLQHAMHNWPVGVLHADNVYDNCRFRCLWENPQFRWWLRLFDAANLVVRSSEFLGLAEEHHLYVNNGAGMRVEDCRFVGAKGAAIQVAFRYTELNPETIDWAQAWKPSETVIERTMFDKIGQPDSERFPAYTVSLQPAELALPAGTVLPDGTTLSEPGFFQRINSRVSLLDNTFRGGHLNFIYNGELWRSSRAIMVTERPSLLMRDNVVDYPDPAFNDCALIVNVDDVALENNDLSEGYVSIKNPHSVRIVGNSGQAWVRIGTGPGSDYKITEYIYQGPIGQDFTWTKPE